MAGYRLKIIISLVALVGSLHGSENAPPRESGGRQFVHYDREIKFNSAGLAVVPPSIAGIDGGWISLSCMNVVFRAIQAYNVDALRSTLEQGYPVTPPAMNLFSLQLQRDQNALVREERRAWFRGDVQGRGIDVLSKNVGIMRHMGRVFSRYLAEHRAPPIGISREQWEQFKKRIKLEEESELEKIPLQRLIPELRSMSEDISSPSVLSIGSQDNLSPHTLYRVEDPEDDGIGPVSGFCGEPEVTVEELYMRKKSVQLRMQHALDDQIAFYQEIFLQNPEAIPENPSLIQRIALQRLWEGRQNIT